MAQGQTALSQNCLRSKMAYFINGPSLGPQGQKWPMVKMAQGQKWPEVKMTSGQKRHIFAMIVKRKR